MERDAEQNRHDQVVGGRNLNNLPGDFFEFGRGSVGQGDNAPAARLDLFHIAERFLVHRVFGQQDDNRHLIVDQGNRSVLHLPGRIALGMNIRQFLELERALKRNRIVDAPPEIQEVAGMAVFLGDLFNRFGLLQRRLDQGGQSNDVFDELPAMVAVEDAAALSEVQGQQIEGGQLCGKRLG